MLRKVFKIVRAILLSACLIVVLLGIFFVYATRIEPYRLRIDTVSF